MREVLGSVRMGLEQEADWRLFREILKYKASTAPEFIDITKEIKDTLARSGIREGSVLIFTRHTTAAIEINEDEPLLITGDWQDAFRVIVHPLLTLRMFFSFFAAGKALRRAIALVVNELVPRSEGCVG